MHWKLDRYTWGDRFGVQDVQFDCKLEHVLQLDVQAVHTLFMPTNPDEHWGTHVLPYRLRVTQAVQLLAKLVHVRQLLVAESQAIAYPLLL